MKRSEEVVTDGRKMKRMISKEALEKGIILNLIILIEMVNMKVKQSMKMKRSEKIDLKMM